MSESPTKGSDGSAHPNGKTISAKAFLAAFREKSDDFFLMQKFSLTPKQLEITYSVLLGKRLISEYEYNYREKKLPELEEKGPNLTAASQISKMIETPSDALAELMLKSGSTLEPAVENALRESRTRIEKIKTSPIIQEPDIQLCPKCARPRNPLSQETCPYCGVVYNKFISDREKKGAPLWRDE